MIPILYRPEETEFRTNGLGRLVDCISCEVTEERNGVYECTFQYPITGRHYSDIKKNCIIAVIHDDKKDIQPFDIYKRTAPIDGVVTFYAHHISYRLRKIVVKPYTAGTCMEAITAIPNNSINTNPFAFWTDKNVPSPFILTAPRVAKDLLSGSAGSILDIYGKGEYEYDKFAVKLYLNRGSDNGVQIRYGKNMTDITQDIDAGDTYSAIVPYWAGSDGTVVTLPENVVVSDETEVRLTPITTETRMVITDGDGNPIEAGYSVIEPVVLDMTQDFAEEPTVEQLRAKAKSKLISSSPWLPTENIKVDFTALWQTPDYDAVAPLQRVSLCDVVSVFYPRLGVNAVKQKVISVTYDVLLERYKQLELGTAKEIYTDIITEKAIQELRKVVPTTAAMQTAIENATQLIKGGLGGHVVIGTDADGKPNEILIMDTEDKLTAVHVWRFNANGWGYSSTGYDGTYTTAATLDGGFVADFITTGILNASLLKTGIITDTKGKNYWNLETGDISISLDPGEIGAVTTADLERVQNNAQTYANNAEANAKSYTDSTL
jgi:phage minor structural protein